MSNLIASECNFRNAILDKTICLKGNTVESYFIVDAAKLTNHFYCIGCFSHRKMYNCPEISSE